MAGLQTMNRAGSRFYVHPDTKVTYPSVTSIVGMLPKPFLTHWAARMAAETAVDNLGSVVDLALRDRGGAVDFIKRAHTRFTKEAADVGTQVHDAFERRARGQAVGRVHPDLGAYMQHIEDFFSRYSPEFQYLEECVWSDEHRFAGSFDAITRIDGETVLIDLKTTRSGVHAEVALQLNAYAAAERLITQDGTETAMPAIDAAAVLHVRPEGWQLVPVLLSKPVFQTFLTLRGVFDWAELSKTVLGTPDYSSTPLTGSQRRTA